MGKVRDLSKSSRKKRETVVRRTSTQLLEMERKFVDNQPEGNGRRGGRAGGLYPEVSDHTLALSSSRRTCGGLGAREAMGRTPSRDRG